MFGLLDVSALECCSFVAAVAAGRHTKVFVNLMIRPEELLLPTSGAEW